MVEVMWLQLQLLERTKIAKKYAIKNKKYNFKFFEKL